MQRRRIFEASPPRPRIMHKPSQPQLNAVPDSLGHKRTRIFVMVSPPIRLPAGAAPIRRFLILDDHPATLRLLGGVDLARKRENKLALVAFSALIVLLMLAMFWPLF